MPAPHPGRPDATSEAARLEELRAAARYHRERRDLYRARSYSGRLSSPTRMRELELEADRAEQRLRHAEAQARRAEG